MHNESIQIRLADLKDKQKWDRYVLSRSDGLAYHLFAWKEAVEKAYKFKCPYFVAEKNAEVCGLLPTVHVHWLFGNGSLVSLPYCDVGGILPDSEEVARALVDHVLDYARKCSISCIELRNIGGRGLDDWSIGVLENCTEKNKQYTNQLINKSTTKVRMVLSLPGSSQSLMSSFKSKIRSQIKKPGRDGLYARLGGLELADDFYAVFAENMRDLGSPVHSKNWIKSILKAYGPRARCGLVYMSDKTPVACGVILLHNQTVSIPWASSLRSFNRYNPNMLLYWMFLEYAADNNYSYFDFGRSTPGEGTYKFKEQWGAKPKPLHWLQIEAQSGTANSLGVLNTPKSSQGKFRQFAEKVFQSLPVSVATCVGSRLRKYISL